MRSAAIAGHESSAFRALERALERRRLRELDPRLGLEIGALAVLQAAVLFWQVRVPLDGWARRHGPLATSAVAAALYGTVALGCAVFSAARLRRGLHSTAGAPEWLTLPCGAGALHRHLEWNARTAGLPFFLLAQLAISAALLHLVPAWALIALAAVAYAATEFAARTGAALALRATVGEAHRDPHVALAEALAGAGRRVHVVRQTAARARPRTPLGAVLAQDLALTRRSPLARWRAVLALALTAGAALVWLAGWPPAIARAVAFGLALLAAASWAEWLIDLTALHPFALLRAQPIGVGAFWGARVCGAVLASALVTASQLPALRVMDAFALRVHLVWTALAALAVTLFGANVAVTLYPRADHARRVFTLSLAIAATASLILPLAGWVLLLTALLHSARRLAPWTRGELLSCS
jgi:hypothetical protein